MNCRYCNGWCNKKGKRNGIQDYRCKECGTSQRSFYKRSPHSDVLRERVVEFTLEGVGISSISRLLKIPKSSVCNIIKYEASKVNPPTSIEVSQVYEIGELKTFISKKANECWVTYAINRETGNVVDFVVGRRTKRNLGKVVASVLQLTPLIVATDGLNSYRSLIPKRIHTSRKSETTRIERKNLTLRTHLKRLVRKSICFSKSLRMLESCLRLYFWYTFSLTSKDSTYEKIGASLPVW